MKTKVNIHSTSSRLPVSALLALAVAGFITILTEALPAGMLVQIGDSLLISQALAGQLVTVYAIGSLLAAIPLTLTTQSIRRRPLLLSAIAGFAVANTLTALSDNYLLTLMARFIAGISAGLLWALLAGYAARMVENSMKGRAIALAMVGTPLALSLGIPLGTWVSEIIGWRSCFLAISLLTLILAGSLYLYLIFPARPQYSIIVYYMFCCDQGYARYYWSLWYLYWPIIFFTPISRHFWAMPVWGTASARSCWYLD